MIIAVAVFYVREKRSGRMPIDGPDRHAHDATREAEANQQRFGPQGPAGTWLG